MSEEKEEEEDTLEDGGFADITDHTVLYLKNIFQQRWYSVHFLSHTPILVDFLHDYYRSIYSN